MKVDIESRIVMEHKHSIRQSNPRWREKTGLHELLLIVLFCYLGLLSACQTTEQRPNGYQYVIGVSLPNVREPWLRRMTEDITAALPASDVNLITKDATGNVVKQQADIEQLMKNQIDVLIVVPQDVAELEETLSMVHEKIPVIVVGVAPSKSVYDSCIRFDDEAVGRMLGEQLLADHRDDEPVVILTGPDSSAISRARLAGLKATLAGRVREEDISYAKGEWLRDQAENRMKDYLVGHRAPTKVFAFNDEMAYGAYIAADQFRVGGIRFYGVEGQEGPFGGRKLVEQGQLSSTICLPSIGRSAMETAVELLNGRSVTKMQVLPGEILTKKDE